MKKRLHKSFLAVSLAVLCLLTLLCAGHIRTILQLPDSTNVLWYTNDTDAWTRLVQARHWLQGGDFHDKTLYQTDAPQHRVQSHWTRLMDIPLVAGAKLLPQTLSADQKLLITATVLPPLIGLLAFLTLLYGAARISPVQNAGLLLALLVFATPNLQFYFRPGFADHHALQSWLWMLSFVFCAQKPSFRNAVLIGLFLAMALWVSVEAMFLIAGVFALFGLLSFHQPAYLKHTALLALSAALFSTAALLIETPPGDVLERTTYDSISIVHVFVLWLCAFGAAALIPLFGAAPGSGRKLAGIAAVGGILAGLLMMTFPKFIMGPLADTDPLADKYLFSVVNDAVPFYRARVQLLAWMLPAGVMALATMVPLLRRRNVAWKDIALAFLLCVAWAMILTQVRWIYYLLPIQVFVLATRLPVLLRYGRPRLPRLLKTLNEREMMYVIIFALMIFASAADRISPPPAVMGQSSCSLQLVRAVQNGVLQKTLAAPPQTVFVHPNYGGVVQFFSPYGIIATYYHREVQGLADIDAISSAASAEDARDTLSRRGVRAMLVCPDAYPETSWLHRLRGGGNLPGWAKAVKLDTSRGDGGLVLLKVNP